ncbi:hypothetical protein M8J77_013240 [Diaphorina citri]|nr:hypothetical protein M8J77_013240 [Diaphorina citri]
MAEPPRPNSTECGGVSAASSPVGSGSARPRQPAGSKPSSLAGGSGCVRPSKKRTSGKRATADIAEESVTGGGSRKKRKQ